MGVSVLWDDAEKKVIRWDFKGRWSQQDLYDAEQATENLLLETQSTVVDLILNLEATSQWPQNAISTLKVILKRVTRGTGVKIIVGAQGFSETLLKMFSKHDQPFAEGLTFVGSLREARELLT